MYIPDLKSIEKAALRLKDIALQTPFTECSSYSKIFNAKIFLKREDLQIVRSYKIRGSYNKISTLTQKERNKGIVCASAGNHAQGVAYSCNSLKIKGTIYMPSTTPKQKIKQVAVFGGDFIDIILKGDTFDDSYKRAIKDTKKTFVHPFNDEKVIEGQATVGYEILSQSSESLDYLILPIGGGGLAAGVSSIFNRLSPQTKIIGVEPQGAPSMKTSINKGKVTKLTKIDRFVDGAAVQCVGEKTFEICNKFLYDVICIPEGAICQTILDLYNKEAIVVEPAGALAMASLSQLEKTIKGKNVGVIISGSNNDISRMSEIKERALLYSQLKHYFIVQFPQRAGALREFVVDVLGPNDDITYFEYQKKHIKEDGPAVVGVELKFIDDLEPLISRMKAKNFYGSYLNKKPDLLNLLV